MIADQDDSRKKSRNIITSSLLRAYQRFLKIRGNPHEIALGFALGLFVGMTPFMGFQTPIAVCFAALFQWNKISSAAGVWISNPVTAPVIYGITYFVGAKMTGMTALCAPAGSTEITVINLLQSTPEILMVMILGGIITGIPIAIAGYYLSFSAGERYQEDIKIKLAKKKEARAVKKQQKKIFKETRFTD